jgi:hypothetical protein
MEIDSEQFEVVEVLEFSEEDEGAVPIKYDKLVVSDDSDSDEDESLEIVIRKVSAHTPIYAVGQLSQPVQRIITPTRKSSPVVTKPKPTGQEKSRFHRLQTDSESLKTQDFIRSSTSGAEYSQKHKESFKS